MTDTERGKKTIREREGEKRKTIKERATRYARAESVNTR